MIKSVLLFVYHCWYLLRKNIIVKSGDVIFTRIKVAKMNILYLANIKVRRSKILVEGKFNKVMIKGEMFNSSINVSGESNKIYIGSSTNIQNLNIIIRGRKCICYIGNETSVGGVRIVCMGEKNNVIIGNRCMFSDNIEIWATDSHSIYNKDREIINCSKSIFIEDNIWIGAHSIILKGVHIRKGAVVGMGSVVTKNLEENTINVGNPCRCIRKDILYWRREHTSV